MYIAISTKRSRILFGGCGFRLPSGNHTQFERERLAPRHGFELRFTGSEGVMGLRFHFGPLAGLLRGRMHAQLLPNMRFRFT